MQNPQTLERGHGMLRNLVAPLLAVTVGGAALVGGCAGDPENEVRPERSRAVPTATTVARTAIDNTVTGRIETLQGEPLRVRSSPFGPEIGEYRDGSTVQVLCSVPGPDAPGDPRDFGKTPYADTTWLQLASPDSGQPFSPPRFIPLNPVFFEASAAPVPACPR